MAQTNRIYATRCAIQFIVGDAIWARRRLATQDAGGTTTKRRHYITPAAAAAAGSADTTHRRKLPGHRVALQHSSTRPFDLVLNWAPCNTGLLVFLTHWYQISRIKLPGYSKNKWVMRWTGVDMSITASFHNCDRGHAPQYLNRETFKITTSVTNSLRKTSSNQQRLLRPK